MVCEWIYCGKLAVALKSAVAGRSYGDGFNVDVQLAFGPVQEPEALRMAVRQVLALVDHKNLVMDVSLGTEAGLSGLMFWLEAKLRSTGLDGLRGIRLTRADGLECATGSLMIPAPRLP